MKVQGSCLCGKIAYEATVDSIHVDHCHCSFCQKFHGAAFGSFLDKVTPENFSWSRGEELVSRYQSSSHSARLFCGVCGASLAAEINGGEVYAVTLGTLDQPINMNSAAHMFWSSKADWCDINDDLDKHDTYPPHLDGFTPTD